MTKIFALILAFTIMFSFCVFAEDTDIVSENPSVAFNISEADENGIFTVDLIIYNATFKGFLATLAYDSEAVTPVAIDTKEPADDFSKIAEVPVKATLEDGTELSDWLSGKGSSIKDSALNIIYVLNNKAKYPNSIVSSKFQALAGENGLNVSRFYFKKIADKEAGFKITESKLTPNGFALINAKGMQSCTVDINCPESMGKSVSVAVDGTVSDKGTKVSDESDADSETLQKRVKARSNGTVFLQIDNYAAVSDSLLKWIDKDNKDVMPFIKDNRTMVPLRFISEELNSKVSYNNDTQEITIENMKTVLVFKIGSLTYTDDGLKKSLDTAPVIVNDRTFVPLRAVSEALDKSVSWLDGDKIVVITAKEYPWAEDNKIEKELLQEIKLMISPMVRDFAYMNEK